MKRAAPYFNSPPFGSILHRGSCLSCLVSLCSFLDPVSVPGPKSWRRWLCSTLSCHALSVEGSRRSSRRFLAPLVYSYHDYCIPSPMSRCCRSDQFLLTRLIFATVSQGGDDGLCVAARRVYEPRKEYLKGRANRVKRSG